MSGEAFQCDPTIQPHIQSEEHLAHSASAKLLEHAVRTVSGAWNKYRFTLFLSRRSNPRDHPAGQRRRADAFRGVVVVEDGQQLVP
jgi:hypothetical protein